MSSYDPSHRPPVGPQVPPPRRETGPKWLPVAAAVTTGFLGLVAAIGGIAVGAGTSTADPAPTATASGPVPKPTTQASTPSASPTEDENPVQSDGTYDTAEDLYSAVVSVVDGVGDWKPDEEASGNASSTGQDADETFTFYVYSDHDTLVSDVNEAHLGDEADSVLVGENWMIVGAQENLDVIEPHLGGEHPTWADKKEKPKAKPKPKPVKAETVSKRQWAKVVKNPDKYVGKRYIIYGEVNQFDSATGDEAFLADTAYRNTISYGYFDGENAYLEGNADKLEDLVEDDVFKATVTVEGSFSYDTQIGGNTTVPKLKVDKIKVVGNND